MKPAACAFLLLLSVSSASAQTPSRAQLVFTILAGAVTGHSLWDVPIQPVAVLDASGQPTGVNDTVHLQREVTSSIVVGASATYFFSPHYGMHAEISYLGLPYDDSCTGTFHPDPGSKNQQVCDDIASRSGAGGSISLYLGATLRAAPGGSLSPYLRGNIGIVTVPHSSVAMIGNFFPGPQQIPFISDPSPRSSGPMFGLAAGFTQPLGRDGGYQFRLEARDVISSFERVTGQADPVTLLAPTEIKSYHHFALVLGLDVVLEQSRGRRY
ncbi:MAG TPA: hypothetical protein VGU74_13470 [Gemmatimonadales bacterium]|nr:hypothetical protein [Gemmatimonadales bacterium]